MKEKHSFFLIISTITLCIGFVPMLVISLRTNSFWLSSPYDFPLVTIPSVLIGDSLLLPFLNYKIFCALRRLMREKNNWLILFFSFLVSIAINSYTHFLWTQDMYTGFMDMTIGTLSFAGWWHWGYSIIQMTIIAYFVVIWMKEMPIIGRKYHKEFMRAWFIFVAFSSLSLLGFILKYLFILDESFIEALRMELVSFFPIILSILWAIFMKYYRARIVNDTSLSKI